VKVEDLVLVSVDDHVVEPPDVFAEHLPKKWLDKAPQLVSKPNGEQYWLFEESLVRNVGLNAVSGRPPEEFGLEPTNFSEMRRGCYDVDERVKDMNANGVVGSMCFPSFPQFCGQLFAKSPDKDLALALVKAYNDWHIDAWCGAHPGRFIPLTLPVLWDPQLAAEEVRRVAAKGAHAVTFSENPYHLGYPSLHSDHWDPFWQACADENVVVCLHIGSSSKQVVTAPDAPMDVLIHLTPINLVQAAADLLWSPVLRKFADLRFALSEGGIGWIPYFLERADYTYIKHHRWTGQEFQGKLPSEYFRDHIVTCFIDDPIGLVNRHAIGVELITWECDYPHSDSTWPTSPETLLGQADGVPDHELDLISHLNAMRVFSFDPFTALGGREHCTVGALRKQARGHDIAVRSFGKKRDEKGVLAADLGALQSSR
jgi:predicted TIM-barrel fold metal-dependent hydrolase